MCWRWVQPKGWTCNFHPQSQAWSQHLQWKQDTCTLTITDLAGGEIMVFHPKNIKTINVSNLPNGWRLLVCWILTLREPKTHPHHWRKHWKRVEDLASPHRPTVRPPSIPSTGEREAVYEGYVVATTSSMPIYIRQLPGWEPDYCRHRPQKCPPHHRLPPLCREEHHRQINPC